jgi:hypothetical protein
MFNSGILDVAIGIVFIYLLVSLIVTAANELIAAIFKMRGRILWQGLCTLLPNGKGKDDIAGKIYRHPLIEGLSHGRRPSYIPSRTFTLALLDVVSGGTGQIASQKDLAMKISELPKGLARPLTLLFSESKHDIDQFKRNIEIWFNDSMDRVSGVYKRRVQYALFFLAFVLAVVLNIDTILLANRLSHDSALRAALVANATSAANEPALRNGPDNQMTLTDREASLNSTIKQLDQLRLPIGWDAPDADLMLPTFSADGVADCLRRHFVGWALTAFAATLGAPFWFDLLNRFVNIRSSGKAPEEKPKGPKELPPASGAGASAPVANPG